jgi:hypothetical protein
MVKKCHIYRLLFISDIAENGRDRYVIEMLTVETCKIVQDPEAT